MKVLVVGPSSRRSKGGMATVIKEIEEDNELRMHYDIDVYESYIDGNLLIRLFYSILAYLRFYLTKRNYDIYHIHVASRGSTFRKGYYVRAAKKWKKKVIFHVHGAQYMEFFEESSEKKKRVIIDIIKSVDMVIALSQDWKNKFDFTFSLNNCVVLENGINMDNLQPAIVDSKMYQHAFVTLGRLGQRKGTYDLVDAVEIAAKKIPDIKVYLAGDGDVEQIRKRVKDKGLEKNIDVVGWADINKKLELLMHISTVVLPSYNEGLPMAILEGMACGKAIISTTVGAIPEVILPENGILISPGDIEALSEALLKCCIDTKFVEACSRANVKKIQCQFSMQVMHTKLVEYYFIVVNDNSYGGNKIEA